MIIAQYNPYAQCFFAYFDKITTYFLIVVFYKVIICSKLFFAMHDISSFEYYTTFHFRYVYVCA